MATTMFVETLETYNIRRDLSAKAEVIQAVRLVKIYLH
jgi:hypothetical protein